MQAHKIATAADAMYDKPLFLEGCFLYNGEQTFAGKAEGGKVYENA